jgi:type IV secretion system protein TrbH
MINRNCVLTLALLTITLVAGCAVGPNTSYVGKLRQPSDLNTVATAMAEFVSMRLPGGPGVLLLNPTPSDQASNALTPAFSSALRRCGFTIGGGSQHLGGNTHRIRYLVTPLDSGVLARLMIDGTTEGSQFFARDSGCSLQPGGPFTVTQVEAAR